MSATRDTYSFGGSSAAQHAPAALVPRARASALSKLSITKLELGAAIILTLAAAYLHGVFLLHAGGLWRDEVVSFNIAAQPSLRQMHEAVHFDSFPSFFHLLLKVWMTVGLAASDLGTRTLGLLIGLSVLAVAWWNARTFGRSVPLFTLLLIGTSALSVRTTDAIRAYGVGILCVSLTFVATWRVAVAPSVRNVALAGVAAVLAVQSSYQNAFLVLAICAAGALVTARNRLWKRTALVIGVGLLAALSLGLYLKAMGQMAEFKQLIVADVGFERISTVALRALTDGNSVRLWSWVGVITGYIAVLARVLRGSSSRALAGLTDVALFSCSTIAISVVCYVLWLKVLSFPTQPWYYLPPMALTCLAIDALAPALATDAKAKVLRLCFVALSALLLIGTALSGVRVRQTNVDILAARLGKLAAPDDFILVNEWYNGTSFGRYFTGPTPWSTLPPLEDYTFQRIDLFKQQMMALKPNAPVERRMADTLKAGRKVWVVGGLPFAKQSAAVPDLAPAPNSPVGWNHDAYSYVWGRQAAQMLQTGALRAARVEVPLEHSVNEYENLPLVVVQGWRGLAERSGE
jgi:hypothetical protein